MPKWFVLILMIFMHIVDDYYLQRLLAKLKQKSFWENDPEGCKPKYKYDYIVALIMHAFSWTFCIMLPVLIYTKFNTTMLWTLIIFGFNTLIHAFIDNEKANRHSINLIVDQSIHLVQIVITYFLFI